MSDWFYEDEDGQLRFGYAISAEVTRVKSKFQDIRVVDSLAYGKVLLIDNVVMITAHDEFVYREMLAHIPACNHPDPKDILVIGGGDGGIVRELTRYKGVNSITLCEIDQKVIQVCQEHFPQLTEGLQDRRVEVVIADGREYLAAAAPASLDMIIVDSTDPVGPGECLFTAEFYGTANRALRPSGVFAAQTESPWARTEMLRAINANITANFAHVHPYIGTVPTYPRGLWSWTLAAQQEIVPQEYDHERFSSIASQLKYLTAELMVGSFYLPKFYRHKLLDS